MEQPRRSDAQNGSDGHQRGEASLEIIGQELVPLSASPGEFLTEAGAIQNPPVSSTEIVLATPQSSMTGPVVSTVANPVLTLGIATPKSVQSAPNGPPTSFGPTGQQVRQQDGGDPRESIGHQGQDLLPLFDDQQLRRFAEIYQQAPMVYPSADFVRRPAFLVRDGRDQEARREEVQSGSGAAIGGPSSGPTLDSSAVSVLLNEVQALRKAQMDVAKENVALRAQVMGLIAQSPGREEEFNTPDRGESVANGSCGDLPEHPKECPDPKEFQTPKVLPRYQECPGSQALPGHKEFHDPNVLPGSKAHEGSGGEHLPAGAVPGPAGPSDQTIQILMKMMEGMTNLQKQIMEKDKDKDTETVRSQVELPPLPPWSSTTGPVDLSDWLVLIEPIMSDLTATSGEWWCGLMTECQSWYSKHIQLQPLDRVAHEPSPSSTLTTSKWLRLERRASTLLLMAVPPDQREELISAKRLTAMKIICHLMVLYQPGGLAEKELILRQLESPPEAVSLSDALQGLRKWSRWRHRATDLGVQEPDPFLLLKGLNRLTRKPLEQHRDLSFRISLARSTLQVDATPTSRTITSFLLHLIAEFEQVVHSEATHSKKRDVPEPKAKTMKPDGGGQRDRGTGGDQGDKKEIPPCRFFLTDSGCRKGRGCRFNHDLKDEKRRCYHCGSPDHLAPQCDKGNGGGLRQKATKAQKDANKDDASSPGPQPDVQPNSNKESISSILEEANRLLKAMGGSENLEASSTTTKPLTSSTTTVAADQSREDMMDKLQQQLNALRQKTLRVSLSRMSGGGVKGLIDSGATHPLRPLRHGDDRALCQKVDVTLADGRKTQLLMNKNGTMLSPSCEIEPIIPMGLLQSALDCKMIWTESELQVLHPTKGKLPVSTEAGCPMLPRALALDLIDEIEQSKVNVQLKGLTADEEMRWLRQLVDDYPALRDLPGDIKANLIATPGQWSDLPYNKRMRKRMKRDGVHLHLYAGPDDGYTLKKALEKLGAQEHQLMEIDVLRGDGHNMLHMNGVYSGLLRCAFDGKLETILGGPNCRSRSILRHVPIPEWPQAPRPVRCWGGGEFGRCDLSQSEKTMVLEDDTMMMRMVVLFLVSSYVKKAKGATHHPWFLLEQPADPYHKNEEVVSWWRTPQWKAIKDEFNFTELTFDQFHLGGECNKMTTVGGSLPVSIDPFQVKRKAPLKGRIHDSKSLSRWAPGMMDAIATSLMQHGLRQEPRMAQLSWADHLKNGHIPYRRDCRVCQETLQLQRPHRKVKNAISGVLSVDTAGPLEPSADVDGSEAKFLLVGALTWLVHREVPLKESLPEGPLPEDAPSLDVILEGDEDQEEEGLGQSSSHDASGNAEEAPRDVCGRGSSSRTRRSRGRAWRLSSSSVSDGDSNAIEECASCASNHHWDDSSVEGQWIPHSPCSLWSRSWISWPLQKVDDFKVNFGDPNSWGWSSGKWSSRKSCSEHQATGPSCVACSRDQHKSLGLCNSLCEWDFGISTTCQTNWFPPVFSSSPMSEKVLENQVSWTNGGDSEVFVSSMGQPRALGVGWQATDHKVCHDAHRSTWTWSSMAGCGAGGGRSTGSPKKNQGKDFSKKLWSKSLGGQLGWWQAASASMRSSSWRRDDSIAEWWRWSGRNRGSRFGEAQEGLCSRRTWRRDPPDQDHRPGWSEKRLGILDWGSWGGGEFFASWEGSIQRVRQGPGWGASEESSQLWSKGGVHPIQTRLHQEASWEGTSSEGSLGGMRKLWGTIWSWAELLRWGRHHGSQDHGGFCCSISVEWFHCWYQDSFFERRILNRTWRNRSFGQTSTIFPGERFHEQGQVLSSTEGHLWVPQKPTTLGPLQRQALDRLWDRGWWCDAAPCSTSIWTQPLENRGKASVGMDWWSETERTASHLRGWHLHRRWRRSKREGAIKSNGDLEDQSPWFGWRKGNQIPWHEHLKGLRWWDQKGGVVCQSRFLHPGLVGEVWRPLEVDPNISWTGHDGAWSSRNNHPWEGKTSPTTCWRASLACHPKQTRYHVCSSLYGCKHHKGTRKGVNGGFSVPWISEIWCGWWSSVCPSGHVIDVHLGSFQRCLLFTRWRTFTWMFGDPPQWISSFLEKWKAAVDHFINCRMWAGWVCQHDHCWRINLGSPPGADI